MRRLSALFAVLLACVLGAPAAQAYFSGSLSPDNPLAGRPWFVDHQYGVWWYTMRDMGKAAAPLAIAAENPMNKTFGSFEPHPEVGLRKYLERAAKQEPGAIPFISLSRIEGQSCPRPDPGPLFSESTIKDWVHRFSNAIGDYRVMVLVEADRLAVMGCLSAQAQEQRYRELRYEIHTMHQQNPNAIVYVDAGASDWVSSSFMTRELRRADIAEARGFALGADHFDWTSNEIKYGQRISRALNGKHFVINTNMNGWGPRPRWYSPYYHGGCEPPGAGIGIRPTVVTPDRHIDAFLWLGTPGYQSGDCVGLGSGYDFHLSEALSLVHNANPPFVNASRSRKRPHKTQAPSGSTRSTGSSQSQAGKLPSTGVMSFQLRAVGR